MALIKAFMALLNHFDVFYHLKLNLNHGTVTCVLVYPAVWRCKIQEAL